MFAKKRKKFAKWQGLKKIQISGKMWEVWSVLESRYLVTLTSSCSNENEPILKYGFRTYRELFTMGTHAL